ncbi:MAG: helix-turn-helix transcriptional regulator [Bacteroidia bacterium]|nr:helix-turn-helix transcriptional regulator [Bacteroidia bacterium]
MAETINWYGMSDPAIVSALGETLRQIRLQQNLTQEQLAKKAGLSRSAISEMENGKAATSLLTIVQVLRALQQLHLLDNWQVAGQVSPLQMAKLAGKERRRASGKGMNDKQEESEW